MRPQNTAGQSNCCTNGPAARVDSTIPDARLADVKPMDSPRRCSGKTDAAMAGAVLYRHPVPNACRNRKPTNASSVGDSDRHAMATR